MEDHGLNRDGTRNVVGPSPLRRLDRDAPPLQLPEEPPILADPCSRCGSREYACWYGKVSLCIECADEEIDRLCAYERTWWGVVRDPFRRMVVTVEEQARAGRRPLLAPVQLPR